MPCSFVILIELAVNVFSSSENPRLLLYLPLLSFLARSFTMTFFLRLHSPFESVSASTLNPLDITNEARFVQVRFTVICMREGGFTDVLFFFQYAIRKSQHLETELRIT